MKTKRAIWLGLLPAVLLFAGCGGGEIESRSMEQIHADDGVPVRVEQVAPQEFETALTYNATLTGIRESSEFAMVTDKVDKIHARVGDRVEKDQVIISFPTDNPAAKYYQAKVAFENARVSHERIENLYASGGISRQDLDNSRTAQEVAKADWDAVRQAVQVRAPISGTLTKVDVRESDNVNKEEELFTVARLDTLKTKIWVPEKNIAEFSIGIPATASWGGLSIDGHVVQVDMSINHARQAFGVALEFYNPGEITKSGVTAQITVATYEQSGSVVIDRKNVQRENGGWYLYVAEDGIAKKRSVTAGRTHETDMEILDGLTWGELLITEGQMLLENGAKINIIGRNEPAVAQN